RSATASKTTIILCALAAPAAMAPLLDDPVTARVGVELPLGDGRVTNHPRAGNVYACRSTFRVGGARHGGPWIHGNTWNPSEKPRAAGRVFWPEAAYTLTPEDAGLVFE